MLKTLKTEWPSILFRFISQVRWKPTVAKRVFQICTSKPTLDFRFSRSEQSSALLGYNRSLLFRNNLLRAYNFILLMQHKNSSISVKTISEHNFVNVDATQNYQELTYSNFCSTEEVKLSN